MVRHVFQVVYREVRGLHQAAYILALFAFMSQVLALVRDRLLAYTFGAGPELDIYYAAFRLPDLLFVIFSSMLSIYVLIPFVAERMKEGDRAGAHFLSQIFSFFVWGYTALALVAFVLAPWIAPILFPGFSTDAHDAVVMLMRILLLQPLLLGISSLFGVVTQLGQRFVLYAISPLLYNVGIIVGIGVLYPFFGLSGLAYGVVLGAAAHVLVQLPFVSRSPLRPRLTVSLDAAQLRTVLLGSLPRALTLSLHQLVLVALVGIASVMVAGSVSIFQFAFNLQSVPLAIIGMSYSVAAFPALAQLFAKREFEEFVQHVLTALRHIIFWSFPAIVLLVVVRAQFVRVILGSGAFDWDDTRLTAAALALFMLSLAAQAVNLLLVRAFYAGGNTRTPLIITAVSSALALCFSVVFYALFQTSSGFAQWVEQLLRVEGVPGTEVLMLALGYSAAMIIHTIFLARAFIRAYAVPTLVLRQSLFRALVASLTGGISAYIALNILVDGIRTDTFIGIFLQGFIAGLVGLVMTVVAYYVGRSPELIEAWQALHRRVFKTKVVVPQEVDDLAA